MKRYLILFFIFLIQSKVFCLNEINLDSITFYISQANIKSYNVNKRKTYLSKALQKIDRMQNDSLKVIFLSKASYRYFKLNDSINFFKINDKAFELAKKNNNDFLKGDLHWNYALYFEDKQMLVRAYYHYDKAFSLFKNHKENANIMLMGMAFIKGRYRDYLGAEKLIIKAIKYFKTKEDNKRLYNLYNNLASIQADIKEYSKAHEYQQKALEYFNLLTNKQKNYIGSYNNIANLYVAQKQYKKALDNYNKDLTLVSKPADSARVINNRAYCRLLLKDTLGVYTSLFKAYAMRNELGNKTDILSSKLTLTKYFKHINKRTKALKFGHEAKVLARELKNGGEYLKALNLLANIDTLNKGIYLQEYIRFNDSLVSTERRVQNKFTRIAFETDEHIAANERLTEERYWLWWAIIAGAIISGLGLFLFTQRIKFRELQLENARQAANEEIYQLNLEKQERLEEELVNERNRISAELHDGVLGKLFGTRVNLGFLGMLLPDNQQEQYTNFLNELQEVEKDIRDVSHKLNANFNKNNINFIFVIEALLKEKSNIANFTYSLADDTNIEWQIFDDFIKVNIYRVLQEALQNIIKHAQASHVSIGFKVEEKKLISTIRDNGVGFDLDVEAEGIGVKNIKNRLKKINGSAHIQSKPNKGTIIVLKTPLLYTNDTTNV